MSNAVNEAARFDLTNESDRGCVLVGAAIIEERLEELFKFVFEKNKIPKKLQSSMFDSNGPLGTLSAKIKVSYSFGFIEKDTYDDLQAIRKIRNEFAHTSKPIDFIESNVSEIIENMHCVQQFKNSMPRYSKKLLQFGESQESEASLRIKGYIKRTKALFSLGVMELEVQLVNSVLRAKSSRVAE